MKHEKKYPCKALPVTRCVLDYMVKTAPSCLLSEKEVCEKSDLDKMAQIYLDIGFEGEQKVADNFALRHTYP